LRPDAITTLGPRRAPNFFRLRRNGTFTDNARTDADFANTLPNHTTMLTGRGVAGDTGHNYTGNLMPPPQLSLHSNKGSYISSVFDVTHDHGLSTGLFVGKEKFLIYEQSYDATTGEADRFGADNGRDKIDLYYCDGDSEILVIAYLAAMTTIPFNYSMLHLRDPDAAGHGANWDLASGSAYLNSVARMDALLGTILETIARDATLQGNTAVVLTTDHGGRLGTILHDPADDAENYTIPFYIWGAGVAAGADLYALNRASRTDSGSAQRSYAEQHQPIRNGDSANLVLAMLGLGPIPDSTINAQQDLHWNLGTSGASRPDSATSASP
jgi:hypothetical protein